MAEISANPQLPHPHLLKPLNKRALWVGLAFMLFFLLSPACWFIWYAFCPDQTVAGRALFLAFAALLLVLPGRTAFVSVRRRMTTGSWKIADEERMRNRAKWAARQTPARERRMQAIFWICDIVNLLAGLTIFWGALRPHHRAQGWSDILVLVVWGFLMVVSIQSIQKKLTKPRTSAPAAGSPPSDSLLS